MYCDICGKFCGYSDRNATDSGGALCDEHLPIETTLDTWQGWDNARGERYQAYANIRGTGAALKTLTLKHDSDGVIELTGTTLVGNGRVPQTLRLHQDDFEVLAIEYLKQRGFKVLADLDWVEHLR